MNETRKMTGKRLLSLWLCLVMVLQWVAPVVSLAADKPTGQTLVVMRNGTEIKDTYTKDDLRSETVDAFGALKLEYHTTLEKYYFEALPPITYLGAGGTEYTFKNWYKESTGENLWIDFYDDNRTEVTNDSIIYALWLEKFVVNLDANGGILDGNSSVEADYGTSIDEPTFTTIPLNKELKGWFYTDVAGDETKWEFDKDKVTSELDLTAKWEYYSVSFNYNNSTSPVVKAGTFKDDGTIDMTDIKPSYAGHEQDGWYYLDGSTKVPFDPNNDTLTKDITLYANWIPYPTVTFDLGEGTYDGKDSIESVQLTSASGTVDDPISDYDNFVKAGAIFDGWYKKLESGKLDTTKWVFGASGTQVTDDITLVAVWDELFTVKFKLDGGTLYKDIDGKESKLDFEVDEINSGDSISATDMPADSDVTKEGYTFGGWYNSNGVDFEFGSTPVTESGTYTARWLYNVEFKVAESTATAPNGVEAPEEQVVTTPTVFFDEITFKEAFDALSDADKAKLEFASPYYQLDSWYTDSDYDTLVKDTDKVSMTAVPKTYYARWERLYKFTYDLKGGEYVKGDITYSDTNVYAEYIEKGKSAPEPVKSKITRSGYTFTGWDFYGDEYVFTKAVNADMEIEAKWEAAVEVNFSVKFGPSTEDYKIAVAEDATMSDLKAAIDARITEDYGASYSVETWYTESFTSGKEVVFTGDTVTDSAGLTYYGTVENTGNTVTVSFDTDGGSTIQDQIITIGGTATKPGVDPTKTGYVFGGWYMEDTCETVWNFATTISTKRTIYAKWLTAVTVTFNADNGTDDKTVDALEGDTLTKPADPEKDGYIFDYWADEDDKEWNFTTGKVGSDPMTLTAVWVKAYTITFLDGSTEISSQTVKTGTEVAKPTDPVKEDFSFKGWFTDAEFKTEAKFPIKVEAETKIYAKYEAVVYHNITFKVNGGKFTDGTDADKVIRVEDGDKINGMPENPSRENYGFEFWVTDPDDETTVWNALNPVTDDVTVYAFWSDKYTYKVAFDGNGKTLTPTIAEQVFTHETDEDKLYVTKPDDPKLTGWIFLNWSTDKSGTTPYDFTTKVTGSLTLYAQWEATYQVYFSTNSGTLEGEQYLYLTEGSKIPEPTVTLKGYILEGWYHRKGTTVSDSDPKWNFSTDKVEKSAVVLYAKWEKDPNDPLTSISVKTTPNQLIYSEGDYFDPWGLVLNLNYQLSDPEELVYTADLGLTFSPSLDTRLTLGTTKVTVYYGDETVDIEIEVKESIRYLYGKVVDSSGEVQSGVNVYLQQNGVNLTNYQYRTDETGMYSFEVNDLAPGSYTVYCYQTVNPGYRTRSEVVYVTGYNQPVDNIVLPDGMISASVNNTSTLTVVSVPNLDALADELANGEDALNSIRVAVNLAEATNSNDKAFINAYKTHGETIGHFFDLSLTKYLTYNNSSTSVTVPITSLKETIVKITIDIPEDIRSKGSYFVYRMHDGEMDRLTSAANEDLEKIEWTSSTITLHVNKFSTYAIAYTEQIVSGDATTGDSEVDGDRFTVTSRKVVNGEEVTDGYVGGTFYLSNNYPVEGTSVYLYPTANVGYAIDYVVAVNENGVEVNLLDGSEGSYYFIQGGSPVTLTVAFRSLPIPVSPEGYQGFYDVNESDWFYDHVLKAAHLGYMVGVDYGVFSPNTGTTRGQIVQILYNLEGKPGASTFSGFPDVYAYDYYAQAITWAKEVGAVAGYDDGYFRPNQEITREEMAVIFFRFAELSVNVTPIMWPFTVEYGDDFAISTWAKQAVIWCTNKGLFTGKNANLFAPTDIASRAEVATCVLALMDQQVVKVETIF